jgi:alkanesulfonate monooxygenase SsuD/methylene tetrahydromethanopterin reductase-like flavin-dependent oxidoreductase (luciferase family)
MVFTGPAWQTGPTAPAGLSEPLMSPIVQLTGNSPVVESQENRVKLGTSLRFLFPTSEQTYPRFKQALAALPPGGFIDRPMGALSTQAQATNLLEVAAAAREADLDMLFFGDHHVVPPDYANSFSPIPTLGRLTAETGTMTLGAVLLAPFYSPVLLAEQLGTLAAFAGGPLVVTLALGQGKGQFEAFGMREDSRVARLEELVAGLRGLLAGEAVTIEGTHHRLAGVTTGPTPAQPVSLWIAGTVPAAARRAGRIGDGWLTGQNADHDQLMEQLDVYRESAERHGRSPVPVLRRDIYVGESDAEAEHVVETILKEGYRGVGMEQLLVGSAETVAQQLADYRSLGFDRVLVRHVVGDHQLMLESFRRIGQGVVPRIREL